MIPIETIATTAHGLMEKAAIEIPDDYLEGLKRAAAAEDHVVSGVAEDRIVACTTGQRFVRRGALMGDRAADQ